MGKIHSLQLKDEAPQSDNLFGVRKLKLELQKVAFLIL